METALFLNRLLSGAVQVVLFTAVPCVWWMIAARKEAGFFPWLGLKKPAVNSKGSLMLAMAVTITVTFLLGELTVWICGDVETAGSAYKGVGAGAVPAILIYAFIQTALSEEILFRGFLLKRLAAKLGFWKGNVIHAAIFGAAHLLMAWGQVGALAGAIIMIYPMAVALLLGYLNENLSGASIVPSWIVHGTLNTMEALLRTF